MPSLASATILDPALMSGIAPGEPSPRRIPPPGKSIPDKARMHLPEPPRPEPPGKIVASGFFDEGGRPAG